MFFDGEKPLFTPYIVRTTPAFHEGVYAQEVPATREPVCDLFADQQAIDWAVIRPRNWPIKRPGSPVREPINAQRVVERRQDAIEDGTFAVTLCGDDRRRVLESARIKLERAALNADLVAQESLAALFLSSRPDDDVGMIWLCAAAEGGSPAAQHDLSVRLRLAGDPRWLTWAKKASKTVSQSIYNLGVEQELRGEERGALLSYANARTPMATYRAGCLTETEDVQGAWELYKLAAKDGYGS